MYDCYDCYGCYDNYKMPYTDQVLCTIESDMHTFKISYVGKNITLVGMP